MSHGRLLLALSAVFVLSSGIRTADADPITLVWNASPQQEGVLGYVVSIENEAGAIVLVQVIGNQTSFAYPDAVAGQEYVFRVAAYNILGTGPASQVSGFSNAPPVLVNPGSKANTVGDAVTLQFAGSDLYGDPLTYGVEGLPPGLTLTASTGFISGTVTTAGIYSLEATAFDGVLTASETFQWIVDGGPPSLTITSPTTQATFSTESSSIIIGGTAHDDLAIGTLTWANSRGGAGTVIGTNAWTTPTIALFAGTNVITITVMDAANHSAATALTVTSPGTAPPTISIGVPTAASSFTTSADRILMSGTATDAVGVTSVTWANNRGGSGVATGTTSWSIPQVLLQPGANVITVTAWNASTSSKSSALTVTWNQAPALTNPGPMTGLQGVPLTTVAVAALDPEGNPLVWSALNLPPGITISASTGALSGTPTALGSFSVTVSVSDGSGTSQASFIWNILSPVPGPAPPISPSGTISTTTPSFAWTAVSVAEYYLLLIEDASAASPTYAWYTPAQAGCAGGVATCTAAAPRPLTSGLVRWSMLTWGPYGGYGAWSNRMEAVVDLADGSTPTPTPLVPAGPVGTRSPGYSWTPVTGAVWYQLSIKDALNVTKEFWFSRQEACSDSSCAAAPNLLLAIGPAQWQVRAWRLSGAGAWSTPLSFETVDAAPGKATLIAPSTPIPSRTPTFTWNAVMGTSYYLLRAVDRDNVEIQRWYRPSEVGCPLGTGTCTASPGGTIHPGPANWQVVTWNGSGYGPWSDPGNFVVDIPDPAAGVPQALSPTEPIVTPNATYKWTAVAGAVSYRLSISNNGGAAATWWFSPGAAGCLSAAECTVTPQVGLLSGTATWRVQAWTVIGHGDWTAPITLSVSFSAPAKPVLVSPTGTTAASPQFVWNASATASLYYIRVYDPTGQRIDRWLTPQSAGCANGTGTCSTNAGVTLSAGAGYWEVIAWNNIDYSPWSGTMAFVVP